MIAGTPFHDAGNAWVCKGFGKRSVYTTSKREMMRQKSVTGKSLELTALRAVVVENGDQGTPFSFSRFIFGALHLLPNVLKIRTNGGIQNS